MYLINKHLLNSARGPFFFGLSVITFLLMIETLFGYVDLFVSKGVSFVVATQVLVLSLGHTFALSIPMSVLVAVLMGIGQLAADNEITAMKASGISLWAILRPLLLAAGGFALAMTAYNHFVFPGMNHTLANLIRDIHHSRPMLEIQEQQFTDLSDRMTIFVKHKDDKTGRIQDVTIFEKAEPGDLSPRLTIAAWGRVLPDHRTNSLLLELHDGEIHERQEAGDPLKYQVIRFAQHNRSIANAEADLQKTDRKAKTDREMNLAELWEASAVEKANRLEVSARVNELTAAFLAWQWDALDPARRALSSGARPLPATEAGGDASPADIFKETRTRAERVVEQSGYQERTRDMYLVKENRYLVEFHKKFAIPFACVVFVVLGVPMAVTASRSGKGISVSLAIAIFLVYYLFLVGGEKLADRGRLDPLLAMWSADLVLLGIGIPIFLKTARESTVLSRTLKPKTGPAVGGPMSPT